MYLSLSGTNSQHLPANPLSTSIAISYPFHRVTQNHLDNAFLNPFSSELYNLIGSTITSHPFNLHPISLDGTYPSVVMVTIVYQKAAGMLVNLLAEDPFSA